MSSQEGSPSSGHETNVPKGMLQQHYWTVYEWFIIIALRIGKSCVISHAHEV